MNVYDFDKTIFYPDSTACFYRYCLRKIPAAVLPTLPRSLRAALRYRRGKTGAKEFKQQLFSFLPEVADLDRLVDGFWRKHEHRIGDWYHAQKRADDLIISASPRFLLDPICKKLGVKLLATEMDPNTGRIDGENCHDHEKTRRLFAHDPDARIDNFYSDSLTDSPLASLAERAYLVKKHVLSPWPKK